MGNRESVHRTMAHGRGGPRQRLRAVGSVSAAIARGGLIALARLYQYTLGAVLPDSCRFAPTCSEYFIGSVRKHGALRGTWLGVRRLLKCHPYHEGGRDPVP